VAGGLDALEGALSLVRGEALAQDVVDVADEGEDVRLDFGERLAREARLELGRALPLLPGGAFDDPVVDEQLLLREVEVVEGEHHVAAPLSAAVQARERRARQTEPEGQVAHEELRGRRRDAHRDR
jgi:hypothetical protein